MTWISSILHSRSTMLGEICRLRLTPNPVKTQSKPANFESFKELLVLHNVKRRVQVKSSHGVPNPIQLCWTLDSTAIIVVKNLPLYAAGPGLLSPVSCQFPFNLKLHVYLSTPRQMQNLRVFILRAMKTSKFLFTPKRFLHSYTTISQILTPNLAKNIKRGF